MTPFEQAKKNIDHLAEGLTYCNLIQGTLNDCEGMTEEETDIIWTAIIAIIKISGRLEETN